MADARPLPTAKRADLLLGTSKNALISYIRIASPLLHGGVNMVSDVVEHTLGGITYSPVGHGVATPQEGDATSPTYTVLLPNVDRRIGRALRTSSAPMTVSLDWYLSSDLDLTVLPRVALAGAAPLVSMTDYHVVDIAASGASQITLTIERRNIEQEPFPHVRATIDVAPGLHR